VQGDAVAAESAVSDAEHERAEALADAQNARRGADSARGAVEAASARR